MVWRHEGTTTMGSLPSFLLLRGQARCAITEMLWQRIWYNKLGLGSLRFGEKLSLPLLLIWCVGDCSQVMSDWKGTTMWWGWAILVGKNIPLVIGWQTNVVYCVVEFSTKNMYKVGGVFIRLKWFGEVNKLCLGHEVIGVTLNRKLIEIGSYCIIK